MSKTLTEAQITTAKARSRLELGVHWRRLDAEAHLGYRKGKRGGVWLVRWRNHHEGGNYKQAPVGITNDINDKPADGILTFEQAVRTAREAVARARTEAASQAAGPAPTVRSAVESYVKERDARERRRTGRNVRSDAGTKLRRYVLGQEKRGYQEAAEAAPLASVQLHALKEDDLIKWREGLPEDLKVTTKQRFVNDLKAALNAAWPRLSADRKKLNPTFLAIVKAGFKAERIDDDDDVSVARDNQILTDEEVGAILQAVCEVDQEQGFDGDLYRIVVCLAATGARYAQVRRMRVGDVQVSARRLMVPGSYKGRGGNSGSDPVPVGDDVIEVLLPAIAGRPSDAPLFERWIHEQEPGGYRVEEISTRSVEKRRTCTSLEDHSGARRYAGGDSLCFAALQHRARPPKGLAHPTGRQIAQHLSQNDRAALREIHCDRLGRPREGGSRVPGAAE
jgi:integrase